MYTAKLSRRITLAYNSDLSGMTLHVFEKETDSFPKEEYKIDSNVLVDVIVDSLKSKKIAEIEDMDSKQFIKKFML